jgi:hypothetical protein|tara:strand:- start:185 stop:475 length:291 start_codon:yes stop_codon:yes gene_type:complete
MLKVQCIRLDTGEVLIGFVKRLWNGDYKISEAQVCIQEIKDGTMEVNLAPWIPFAKEYTFVINSGLIQTVFDAKPQLTTNFKVATGNNFQRGKVGK